MRTLRLSRAIVVGVVAFVTLLGVFVFAVTSITGSTDSKLSRTVRAQHVQLLEGCARLNVLRAEDNRNQLADYQYENTFLALLPASETKTAKQRANLKRFTAPLRGAVNAKAWVPLTDCAKAVNTQGARYRPPTPISFAARMPTPADLTAPSQP